MPETPLDMIEGIEEQLDQAKLSTLFVFVREYWTLPIEIKHKSQEVYAYVRKITELTHQLEMTEGRIMQEVAAETDPDGKKIFTNKETREAEVRHRTNSFKDWQDFKSEEVETSYKLGIAKIELEFLNNLMSRNKTILNYLGAIRN
jgi:hypothetical protein